MKRLKPPLPFSGHKGTWAPELSEIASNLPRGGGDFFVFDVFGGSGCCAEIFSRARPDLVVFWNDFDNYQERLQNAPITEELRRFFVEKLGHSAKKGAFISPFSDDERAFIFSTLDERAARGLYTDEKSLARWFYLYTAKGRLLHARTGKLHNRLPQTPLRLNACAQWCSGVRRSSVAFSGLNTVYPWGQDGLRLRDLVGAQNALLILDPPYLGTGVNDYSNRDALFVLEHVVECCEHLPFLMFADKSIGFWFEHIFKGRDVLRLEKSYSNLGLNHEARTEVLFCALPK